MRKSPTRRSVVFAGGGSGGHLFPGIAVAREILAHESGVRMLFVGSQKGIEKDIIGNAGFEHIALPSVSPSFAPNRFGSSLLKNWRAYRQACSVISQEQPNVVVGLGGFASVPPVLAAWRGGVPIVLLEQNIVPGKATRWLSRFSEIVCLPWRQAGDRLPRGVKTVVTGNPIRQEIARLADATLGPRTSAKLTLLILGGSQGAKSLNTTMLDVISTLQTELNGWRIVHQTGAEDFDEIRRRYSELSLLVDVQPFLADMADQYQHATFVISRAGATTLAELACAGLPAVLVPLPTSAHDHQRLNARLFADYNAALVCYASSSAVDSMRSCLIRLLNDRSLRDQLRKNLFALAKPNAARDVAEIILNRWTIGNSYVSTNS